MNGSGELIVYPSSGVRRRPSTFIIDFLISEAACPIKAKFHLELQGEGGMKVCLNGSGHMTKMAATPIYGIKPKKSSSEPNVIMILKLGMHHRGLNQALKCLFK